MTATFPPPVAPVAPPATPAPSPRIFLPAATTPKSHVNWNLAGVATTTIWFASFNQSSGAVGDECSYEFYAEAGTYTLDTFWSTNANRGTVQISIDGVNVGTPVDTYNTSAGNVRNTVTGIALDDGLHTIRLVVTSKNAAASNFFALYCGANLTRTGA